MNLDRTLSKYIIGTIAVATMATAQAQGRNVTDTQSCQATTSWQIESLFDVWNSALQTGDPERVVALYAENSALLPTLSAQPRLTRREKLEYFEKFLLLKPSGKLDSVWVSIGCNSAVQSGLYTFSLKDGQKVKARYTFTYEYQHPDWKITSHHSSAAPP